VTGERPGQAGWLDPSEASAARRAQRRQNSPVPLAMFAHRQYMRKRNCAARSDEKPLRTESSSAGRFRSCVNHSYPEGKRLLLCISTDARLWRSPEGDRPNERRRKAGQSERANRGGHAVAARPVKTFRAPAVQKQAPLACG